ncbi:MAG: hypothetical protein WAQ25_05030 [Candidatus Saccharimonas sp.]
MAHSPKRLIIINSVGALVYMSLLLQAVWAVIIIGYPLIISTDRSWFFPSAPSTSPPPTPISPEFSPVIGAITAVIAVAFILLTIIVFIRLPKAIGQQGAKATRVASQSLVPMVTQHKKIPKKRFITLDYRLTVAIKIAVSVVCFLVLFAAPPIASLAHSLILVAGLFLLLCTLCLVGLQAALVALFNVERKKVW